MNVRRMALAVAFTALVAIPAAWAAGLWSTLPIAGGSSYCASTVTGTGGLGGVTGQGQGSTGSICAQTVPAGTSPAFTGTETFPFDTNLTGGAQPSSQLAMLCQLGGGGYSVVAPTTGSSVTIANNTCWYIVDGSGTISSLTITMPANPLDGQLQRIVSDQTITTLVVAANTGQSIKNAPTALTTNSTGSYNYGWIYRASNTTWYRVQ